MTSRSSWLTLDERRSLGAVLRELRGERTLAAICAAYLAACRRSSSDESNQSRRGVSVWWLQRVERGRQPLTRAQLERLCLALSGPGGTGAEEWMVDSVLLLMETRLERRELLRALAGEQHGARRAHGRVDQGAILPATQNTK